MSSSITSSIITLADRAIQLGLSTTTAMDISAGHPGVAVHGTVNPRADDWKSRYGVPSTQIEYNPANWAGAHAPAANIDAPDLYEAAMNWYFSKDNNGDGIPLTVTWHDLADLDLIEGLTRKVMTIAAQAGIKVGFGGQVVAVGSVGSGPGQVGQVPVPVAGPIIPPAGSGSPSGDTSTADAATIAALRQKLATAQLETSKAQADEIDDIAAMQGLIKAAKLAEKSLPVSPGGAPAKALRLLIQTIRDTLQPRIDA